ncbi:hypothetical protein H6P81_010626 [Aristolochia fimbriata]|uniref:Uncharacterized protein n=1 Tax=Aristolochia fimbriata TaxID=158543 RepID=A0AAV7ESQ0_ARIFI|nr:hypothetical protein H6P81_010626 [Aristolochia fimbriata]
MGDVSARMDRLEAEMYALQASSAAIQRAQTLIALRCFHLTAHEQEELEVLLQSPPIEESHVLSSLPVEPYSSIAEDPPPVSPPPLSDLQHFPPLPLPVPPLRHSSPPYAESHLDAMDDPFEAHLIDFPLSDHSLPLMHPVASRPALRMDSPTPDAVSTSPQQSVHRQPFDGSFRRIVQAFILPLPLHVHVSCRTHGVPPLLLQLSPRFSRGRMSDHCPTLMWAVMPYSVEVSLLLVFIFATPTGPWCATYPVPSGDVQPCGQIVILMSQVTFELPIQTCCPTIATCHG